MYFFTSLNDTLNNILLSKNENVDIQYFPLTQNNIS